MKNIKILLIVLFSFGIFTQSLASDIYFVDIKKILNNSKAGKKAQTFLKSKLENGIKNIQNKQKKIQEEEKKMIQQKKVITQEEYVKKVNNLRKKVSSLQVERNSLLEKISKDRSNAKTELLKNLNPIDFIEKKSFTIFAYSSIVYLSCA